MLIVKNRQKRQKRKIEDRIWKMCHWKSRENCSSNVLLSRKSFIGNFLIETLSVSIQFTCDFYQHKWAVKSVQFCRTAQGRRLIAVHVKIGKFQSFNDSQPKKVPHKKVLSEACKSLQLPKSKKPNLIYNQKVANRQKIFIIVTVELVNNSTEKREN